MAKGLVNVQGKPAKKNTQDKAPERKLIAQNKKARHDYHIIDTYECGVVLMGTEVKSLRMGRASLVDGFVQIDGHEAWLHNVHVPEYSQGSWTNHSAKRKRKLLLHRAEIDKLESKAQETGHTIVPLALYFLGGRVKCEIALAKGKKEYDKRQTLREKQDTRETSRAIAAAKRRQRAAQAV
ncbi:SsrA-binding protein SmpB [Streptomyces sp.]|uniref:SsrA-binding protein SmpB n=1 Tax=Streptomyces sp. TaxID=1931 RepID=UPI002F93B2FA